MWKWRDCKSETANQSSIFRNKTVALDFRLVFGTSHLVRCRHSFVVGGRGRAAAAEDDLGNRRRVRRGVHRWRERERREAGGRPQRNVHSGRRLVGQHHHCRLCYSGSSLQKGKQVYITAYSSTEMGSITHMELFTPPKFHQNPLIGRCSSLWYAQRGTLPMFFTWPWVWPLTWLCSAVLDLGDLLFDLDSCDPDRDLCDAELLRLLFLSSAASQNKTSQKQRRFVLSFFFFFSLWNVNWILDTLPERQIPVAAVESQNSNPRDSLKTRFWPFASALMLSGIDSLFPDECFCPPIVKCCAPTELCEPRALWLWPLGERDRGLWLLGELVALLLDMRGTSILFAVSGTSMVTACACADRVLTRVRPERCGR